MRISFFKIVRILTPIILVCLRSITLTAQDGLVVINELNPEGGCNQYIELINLGPGRQNIGCYKIVNEKYAITIPPNTYLDPGKIFLIAGVGSITCGSANNKMVDLNWTNCTSCTSVALTQNQFFVGWSTGSQSHPLALLNSSDHLIDAIRSPGSTLVTLQPVTTNTASSSGTGCTRSTIYLPTDIHSTSTVYESIQQNLGNNSTFSRNGDGSCEWFKAETNTRTPGLNNAISGTTPKIAVTSNYNLSCAENSYTSMLTLNINYDSYPSYWVSSAYSLNASFNPIVSSTPTQQSTSTAMQFNNLAAGFYSYLFSPTQNATCGQVPVLIQVIDPILTVSPTYNFDCVGGTANFQITNVGANNTSAPYYFPMSYTLDKMNSGVFVSNYTTTTKTTPDYVQLSGLPAGDYRMTLTPASAFACPKSINFTVSPLPPINLTTSITTVPACDATLTGRATIKITNLQHQDYYPIYYVLKKAETSTVIASNSFSNQELYLSGLAPGNYSIELDPTLGGCLTNTFPISISSIGCEALSQKLKSFTGRHIGLQNEFNIEIDTDAILDMIHLESSSDGRIFKEEAEIPFENKKGLQNITFRHPNSENIFYRLELHDIYNNFFQSPIIKIMNASGNIGIKTFPNPAGNFITLTKVATVEDTIIIHLFTASGKMVHEEIFKIKNGNNTLSINASKLPKGQYILSMYNKSTGERQSSTIIK